MEHNRRLGGVLLPLASLPSREGAGCLGREAYRFVDMLSEAGAGIWQILPLNPMGYGNSPYQPFSSYAGDEIYISLEALEQEGLLSRTEPFPEEAGAERIDYASVRAWKEPYLRQACRCFYEERGETEAFGRFCRQAWVYPYAVFRALKKQNGMASWVDWPAGQRDWVLNRDYDIRPLEEEIRYHLFTQYVFSRQWQALKSYANAKHVFIMGDVPFYVGLDSADVWAGREFFLLDDTFRPAFVGGCPPDGFTEEGQRWGNPVYDWNRLEQDGFRFWIDRLTYAARLYDILRLDHFRGFDTYWKIPADCPTAVDGTWVEAPGRALFETLFREKQDWWIVAEDLGGEDCPSVAALRDSLELPGMNVADFTLLSDSYVPRERQVIYSGTHDNQTVRGWYGDLPRREKQRFRHALAACGTPREAISKKMVRYVYRSVCRIAIVPLPDLLDLDDRARINTPGTVGSPNWEWKLSDWNGLKRKSRFLAQTLLESGRSTKEEAND